LGAVLEPQIVVAVTLEPLEEGLGGGVEAYGPFEGVAPEEDVESAFFLLEEGADVFLEVGGNEVREMSTKVYAADLGSERKGG